MLNPTPMTKIRLTGIKTSLKQVIDVLHALKIMHFVDFHKKDKDFLERGTIFSEASELSGQIVKATSAINHFEVNGKGRQVDNPTQAIKKFSGFFEEFSSISQEIAGLSFRESGLKSSLAEPMGKIRIDQKYLENSGHLAVFSGIAKKSVRHALENSGAGFELLEHKTGGIYACVIFCAKKNEAKARQAISLSGFSEQKIPTGFSEKNVSAELASVQKKLEQAKAQLEKLGQDNMQFLLDFQHTMRQLNEKAEAPLMFGESENTFVATGWIPTDTVEKIKEKIAKIPKVHVEFSESKKGAPIRLSNPGPAQPFEFFLDMYNLPKYTELDPTMIMAFTFPLFFGFMLGDVGYGLLMLGLFWFVGKKTKGALKSLSGAIMWGAVASIIFGFVFGEFFGYEFIEHPLLNRVHDPTLALGVSVLVGVIHVNLGLLLGFYNELKSHGLKHAFLAKISWLLLQAGIALIVVDAIGIAKIGVLPGAALALASVVMLYLGEGAKGIVELPSIFSNILSYGRLFAVGLSSASIAIVVNEMAGAMFAGGIIGAIIGVIVLVIGHVLNILLGLIGPSLHGIRLHYVEFFSKFFQGGGKKYSPFGLATE